MDRIGPHLFHLSGFATMVLFQTNCSPLVTCGTIEVVVGMSHCTEYTVLIKLVGSRSRVLVSQKASQTFCPFETVQKANFHDQCDFMIM